MAFRLLLCVSLFSLSLFYCRSSGRLLSLIPGKKKKKKMMMKNTTQETGIDRRIRRMAGIASPKTLGSPRFLVLDEEEEERRGTHIGIRIKGGNFDNPISVEELPPSRLGSRSRPISLEGKGSDSNDPISVEDYHGEVDEDIALQIAIAESLGDSEESEEVQIFEADPDDPKGKKPIAAHKLRTPGRDFAGELKVVEVGQSSNPPPAEPEIDCGICMEAKFGHDLFYIEGCSHFYCCSCVSQYVAAKVEENVTSIGCPDPGCKDGFLTPEICRLIIAPQVFDRWGSTLCEAMIVESMKFYCPYKDCSALLIDEGGKEIIISECPHCHRLFCAQCKVPWHPEVTCKEFQAMSADERGREDLMLKSMAKKRQWQRCPKCKFYVERVDGCMFIKCRCRYTFCYGCATEMKVNHYCTKCKR